MLSRAIAFGIDSHNPSKSMCPKSSSQSLSKTPSSHRPDIPSISNSQLCNAQQVSQISSTLPTPYMQTHIFKILHLPFRMPKVNSTSFPINSTHLDHHVLSILLVEEKGGMVQDHARYPLSTMKYTPLYITEITLLSMLYARSSNSLSVSISSFLTRVKMCQTLP